MNLHAAHSMLAALKVGDLVTYSDLPTRVVICQVQQELRTDPGGGSWDHAKVTVGFGPGRWNTEVSAVGIALDHYSIEVIGQ